MAWPASLEQGAGVQRVHGLNPGWAGQFLCSSRPPPSPFPSNRLLWMTASEFMVIGITCRVLHTLHIV